MRRGRRRHDESAGRDRRGRLQRATDASTSRWPQITAARADRAAAGRRDVHAGGGPEIATGVSPRYIAAADFNGDARPDLAVTNHGSAKVAILLGQPGADSRRRPGRRFAVGVMPWAVVAADVNGDGRPDLAVADGGSDTVTLLERGADRRVHADGGLAGEGPRPAGRGSRPPTSTATGGSTSPSASSPHEHAVRAAAPARRRVRARCRLAAGRGRRIRTTWSATDFNRDGKPDLATTNNAVGQRDRAAEHDARSGARRRRLRRHRPRRPRSTRGSCSPGRSPRPP